ncbi:MAG: transposase family protein [Streptococcus thermophilus]
MLSQEDLQLIQFLLEIIGVMLTESEEQRRETVRLAVQSRRETLQSMYDAINNMIAGAPEFLLTEKEELMYAANSAHFRREKNLGYWTVTHPNLKDDYSTQSYYAHYRMRKASFDKLVNDLSEHPKFQLTAANATPTYIQVACVIWRYANCHVGFRTAEATLGISYGSYHNFSERFQEALIDIYKPILNWASTAEEFNNIKKGFEFPDSEFAVRRLQHVIGAIDGKLLTIHRPKLNSESFRDRKNNLSVNLTAVCDNKCRFRYAYIGESGRRHDARVFQRRRVPSYMENPDRYFPDGAYLLGDSAYPLSQYLITPYSQAESNADTTKAQFNEVFSGMRQLIETAFGRMVIKWRFLSKYIYLLDSERVIRVVTCCLILHNFCIDMNEKDGEEEEEEGGFVLSDLPQPENQEGINGPLDSQINSGTLDDDNLNAINPPSRQLGLRVREELKQFVQTLSSNQ